MTAVKFGDRHPVTWTVNMDLTGSTVRLLARGSDGITQSLTATASSPTGGVVSHQLTGTLPVGTYDVELEITQGGSIFTAPSQGFDRLTVYPDLG